MFLHNYNGPQMSDSYNRPIVFMQNEKHSGTVRMAIMNTINFELIDENLYELKQHFGHLDRKLLQQSQCVRNASLKLSFGCSVTISEIILTVEHQIA